MAFLVHNENDQGSGEKIAPRLLEYANAVFKHLDPRLEKIARRAIGTEFYPTETEREAIGLSTNSFREQLSYKEANDPTIIDRFRKWGIGAVVDSVKQQDVNLLGGDALGDAYILRNLESIMAFAESKGIDVMLGRYSGDELLAFFAPKEYMSADQLAKEFSEFNADFLTKNHPTNNALQELLPKLQETHGKDLQIGAHIKAIKLSGTRYYTDKTHRERQILGQVIDHIEGKGRRGGDKDLAEGLLENWKTVRTLNKPEEIRSFEQLLPHSIKELYLQAIKDGVTENVAASYAEDAAFEGLYPRLTIYRMEVFDEMLEQAILHNEQIGQKMIITKAASPFLKWVNKFISHAAGDHLMLKVAETIRPDSSAITFQYRGSFVQLHVANLLRAFETYEQTVQLDTKEPALEEDNYTPDSYTVVTTQIADENGNFFAAEVDRNTSRDTIWRYIQELGGQQTVNELAVLITRCGSHIGAIENLINYLSVRINRLEQGKEVTDYLEEIGDITAPTAERVRQAQENLARLH